MTVIMYRRAPHLRRRWWWSRVLVLKILWIILEIEDRLRLIWISKMLASFLLALLLIPPVLYLYVALKVLRSAVKTIFQWIYPKCVLVSSNSLRCPLDTRRNPGIITILLTLRGKVGTAEACQRILADIIDKTAVTTEGQRSGQPAFPNLRRILTTKLGWRVWKDDEQFCIENHVTLAEPRWKGRPITEANLQSFISEQCCRPFPKKMSPWQVLLIPVQSGNVSKAESTLILIRMHHLLSEGLSIQRILKKTLTCSSVEPLSPRPPPSPFTPTSPSPRSPFQRIPETYSVFANSSATKQTLQQIVDSTQTTIRTVKSKCDLKDLQDESMAEWSLVRKLLKTLRSLSREFQKTYEMTDSYSIGCGAWYRAGALIYFAPRLLGRFEWTMTVSILTLFKRVFYTVVYSPLRLFQLMAVLCCTLCQGCMLSVAEIRLFLENGRPAYILFKQTCREIWETVQTIVVAPSLILDEFLQQSNQYPLLRRSGAGRKVVVWSEPISVDVLQKVKESCSATASEVLASVCAGSLTQYFKMMGLEVPDNILATIPIYSKDFVTAEESDADGFITLSLPTGDVDDSARLTATRRRMEAVRTSPSKYLVSVALLNYLRHVLPDSILAVVVKFLSRQYLILLTNIVIPSGTRFKTWGRDVQGIGYWKPPQANTALSLNLVTYNNQVTLMAMTDQAIVPQPEIITEHFTKQFNSLARTLGVRRERRTSPHTTI